MEKALFMPSREASLRGDLEALGEVFGSIWKRPGSSAGTSCTPTPTQSFTVSTRALPLKARCGPPLPSSEPWSPLDSQGCGSSFYK